MIYLGKTPSLLFAPVLIIGVFTAAIGASGLGLLLSSFNVKYRDVRYILPFFIQTMLFLTPVIYPTALVRPSNRLIMALNPMTGVIEAVRTTISGSLNVDWTLLFISFASSLVFFIIGLIYFRQTESFFADIV